jgi:predicted enzyme related to lactoylglutathione lyase
MQRVGRGSAATTGRRPKNPLGNTDTTVSPRARRLALTNRIPRSIKGEQQMSNTINSVTWFEIGTDDVPAAQDFYGGLFGWTFQADDGPMDYQMITTPGADRPTGGIAGTGGGSPNYAVFYVQVADVPATVVAAETKGGKVVLPPQSAPNGLVFAHVLDPAGNLFAVYTPPAGQ